MEKNGTLASPAMARASSVLPVPGGPTIRTPRGMRPPSFWKREGSRRKSTISWTSSLASSAPATSAKVTGLLFSSSMRARLLPNEKAPPRPPPCIWRMKKIQTPMSSSMGNHEMKICISTDCSSSGLALTCTPYFIRSLTIQMSPVDGTYVDRVRPSRVRTRTARPSICTLSTWPFSASFMNWEYGMSPTRPCRVSNCRNTVNRTRAMITQTAALENALFTCSSSLGMQTKRLQPVDSTLLRRIFRAFVPDGTKPSVNSPFRPRWPQKPPG